MIKESSSIDTRVTDLESSYNDAETVGGSPTPTQELSIDLKDQSEMNKLIRKNVLFSCLFSLMMINTLFLNVENILPTWIPDHFPNLHAIHISFILR